MLSNELIHEWNVSIIRHSEIQPQIQSVFLVFHWWNQEIANKSTLNPAIRSFNQVPTHHTFSSFRCIFVSRVQSLLLIKNILRKIVHEPNQSQDHMVHWLISTPWHLQSTSQPIWTHPNGTLSKSHICIHSKYKSIIIIVWHCNSA